MDEDYKGFYTFSSFTNKMQSLPRGASKKLINAAVTLFVILNESATPLIVKGSIVFALGYLICPLDAIPDFLIPIGLTDDLAVIMAALVKLKRYKDAGVEVRVETMLENWQLT